MNGLIVMYIESHKTGTYSNKIIKHFVQLNVFRSVNNENKKKVVINGLIRLNKFVCTECVLLTRFCKVKQISKKKCFVRSALLFELECVIKFVKKKFLVSYIHYSVSLQQLTIYI